MKITTIEMYPLGSFFNSCTAILVINESLKKKMRGVNTFLYYLSPQFIVFPVKFCHE